MLQTAPKGKCTTTLAVASSSSLKAHYIRTVLDVATKLDQERKDGMVRSKLHGVPVLLKSVAEKCDASHADRSLLETQSPPSPQWGWKRRLAPLH